jgi:protein-S-isoprenylcysteine O-methyltransferase Ste14
MKLKRAIGVACGIAVYAGLTILGGGGIARFFTERAHIALMVVLTALTVASLFTDASLSPGVREDRSNRWVLGVFGLIGILSAWLPAYTERIDCWIVHGNAWQWIGVALFGAGGALRLWPVFVLGRRFSGLVAIQPGHALVKSGLYGSIRHPSYLGLLISSFGWGLAFRSWLGILLAAATIPPLIARMHAEERLLDSEFGKEYVQYSARTWRLIPGVY